MTKFADVCHQRKGRRSCPALGGLICSQCCLENTASHEFPALPIVPIWTPAMTISTRTAGEQFGRSDRGLYRQLSEVGGGQSGCPF